ncbi:DUF3105 domain-containing protein [Streptomyces botrytidirepellens]|uniref:DUF3105 domain-containing protein n=1 Tax=Streptomyces botrytidirepellens TaxID=2486417 RepID=A0A3M8X1C6_9ACTN|nr:DUF3105 domain-containing protein [Streptomyces botrytidirepellens]RNG34193.1 DUF3105 domain-containing protein [Streptomyces botrytidirepellens]
MASKASKTKGAAERRAKIEELRRAEKARERRYRIITITSCTVIVAGLAVGGFFLVDAGNKKEEKAAKVSSSVVKTGEFKGMKTWKNLGRTHVGGTVKYAMSPPVGGNHNQVWQNCDGDVYTKPLTKENAVHSLEHGAVWVTYSDKASKEDVATLKARVEKTKYSLMSPYEDQDAPIVLNAWGNQLEIQKASDPRVAAFFKKFVQGKQTPEPNAYCTNGKSS